MSTAQASTQALVEAQKQEATQEQKRRSVSNPFAWRVDAGADGVRSVVLVCGGHDVTLGVLHEVAGKGFQVLREGTNLAKGDTAQATIAAAAYYAGRNLLSRAATRDLEESTRASVTTANERAKAAESAKSQAECQMRVMQGVMLNGVITREDVIGAGEEFLRDFVSKLPENRRRPAQEKLAAALKGE